MPHLGFHDSPTDWCTVTSGSHPHVDTLKYNVLHTVRYMNKRSHTKAKLIELSNTKSPTFCPMKINIHRILSANGTYQIYTYLNQSVFTWRDMSYPTIVQIIVTLPADCSTSTVEFRIQSISVNLEDKYVKGSEISFSQARLVFFLLISCIVPHLSFVSLVQVNILVYMHIYILLYHVSIEHVFIKFHKEIS